MNGPRIRGRTFLDVDNFWKFEVAISINDNEIDDFVFLSKENYSNKDDAHNQMKIHVKDVLEMIKKSLSELNIPITKIENRSKDKVGGAECIDSLK